MLSARPSEVGSDSLQGKKELFSVWAFERVFCGKVLKWEV